MQEWPLLSVLVQMAVMLLLLWMIEVGLVLVMVLLLVALVVVLELQAMSVLMVVRKEKLHPPQRCLTVLLWALPASCAVAAYMPDSKGMSRSV